MQFSWENCRTLWNWTVNKSCENWRKAAASKHMKWEAYVVKFSGSAISGHVEFKPFVQFGLLEYCTELGEWLQFSWGSWMSQGAPTLARSMEPNEEVTARSYHFRLSGCVVVALHAVHDSMHTFHEHRFSFWVHNRALKSVLAPSPDWALQRLIP